MDFNKISKVYQEQSLVQVTAAQKLIDLLSFKADADVLDLGAGTGNITAQLKQKTSGRVVGVDQSLGMIEEARGSYEDKGIEFQVMADNELSFSDEFDVVFCNSTFQWFRQPLLSLKKIKQSLRPLGRLGIQAPATNNYCPNFITAMSQACHSGELKDVYAGFQKPWFFLDTPEEYGDLLQSAGFEIRHCFFETVHRHCPPQEAFAVFESGAAAGYLNPAYYNEDLPEGYYAAVLEGVSKAFADQANSDGIVDLVFHRIYVVGENPAS